MMLLEKYARRLALTACALIVAAVAFSAVHANDGHTFKVHNKSSKTIKNMLASEDGEHWGRFDIGDGIEPGQTVKIAWSRSTDDQACEQEFKVVFEDGSETAPAKFDFCDESIVLEVSGD